MALSASDLVEARLWLSDQGSSCVQQIQIDNAAGGTFTLTFNGQTTVPIPFDAGANVVQNALAALSNIGVGNVTVNNNNPWIIYFVESLGHQALSMLTINAGSLTGTGVVANITLITAGGVYAFSDDELNTCYSRAFNNFFRAIAYGFRILQSNAAKFNSYTAGQTSEQKNQIYDHLADMAAHFESWAQAKAQISIVGMRPVPPRLKARPFDQGATNSVNQSVGTAGNWPYRGGAWWADDFFSQGW